MGEQSPEVHSGGGHIEANLATEAALSIQFVRDALNVTLGVEVQILQEDRMLTRYACKQTDEVM